MKEAYGEEATYWMGRAERESRLAQEAPMPSQAVFHRNQAQRFLDIAFAKARIPITDRVAAR